jgi:hypothetical protein
LEFSYFESLDYSLPNYHSIYFIHLSCPPSSYSITISKKDIKSQLSQEKAMHPKEGL